MKPSDFDKLDEDHKNVLRFKCEGISPKVVAQKLAIHESTVYRYQNEALLTLGFEGKDFGEMFEEFKKQNGCELLTKTPEELKEMEQKTSEEQRRSVPRILYLVVGLVLGFVLFQGYMWLRDGFFSPQETQPSPIITTETPSMTLASTPETPEVQLSDTPDVIGLIDDPTSTQTTSSTPEPSNTPEPTFTSEPTVTRTPTPAPLFFDNFDTGISEEWRVFGDTAIVDQKLTFIQDTVMIIGDDSWTNYEIQFDASNMSCQNAVRSTGLLVGLRTKDEINMVALRMHKDAGCGGAWFEIVNGERKKIPGADFVLGPVDSEGVRHIVITVRGDSFSAEFGTTIIIDGYPNGGVYLDIDRNFVMDNFMVRELP